MQFIWMRTATKNQRRTFDAGCKLQVVKLIRDQGLSVGDVCRDMKLDASALRRWLARVGEAAAGRRGLAWGQCQDFCV